MVSIYVLKLKYNKYYIGKTINPNYRLKDHFSKGGSEWTKKYKPVSIIELKHNCNDSDEQIVTQDYMKRYGIENVRGGPWCQVTLPKKTIDSIQHILRANNDICYKCGKSGHFANVCPSKLTTKSNPKPKPKKCTRCGRTGHTLKTCYAETDVFGNFIDSSEDESSEDESYSNRKCYRCGRQAHTKTNCYASTHIKGYYL